MPFRLHPIVNELGSTKVEYQIAVKANFAANLFATNVVLSIPTPLNTANISSRVTQGKAKYEPSTNTIEWKYVETLTVERSLISFRIPKFGGQAEYVLSAEADLTSMTTQKAWSRPPIAMDFSLLMFTSSGLLVRYLKVFEKSNYNSVKCKYLYRTRLRYCYCRPA